MKQLLLASAVIWLIGAVALAPVIAAWLRKARGPRQAMPPTYITIDGYCPFLTCSEPSPHQHAVCPDCGAVRYGNMFCGTCVAHQEVERDALRLIGGAS